MRFDFLKVKTAFERISVSNLKKHNTSAILDETLVFVQN
jgi:hypothetical protein